MINISTSPFVPPTRRAYHVYSHFPFDSNHLCLGFPYARNERTHRETHGTISLQPDCNSFQPVIVQLMNIWHLMLMNLLSFIKLPMTSIIFTLPNYYYTIQRAWWLFPEGFTICAVRAGSRNIGVSHHFVEMDCTVAGCPGFQPVSSMVYRA